MALPNKKINKIKLPVDGQGSQTYEIIPERLENGGYEAALPTLTQDSVLALQGEVITQVESAAEVPDNVSGLYRYPEEASFGEQSSHVIEVMRKDYDESEVIFEKTTQTNNTQLTSTTFFNQFADALPGWLSISAIGGVYALYYNLPFNGIRFGAGSSAGSIVRPLYMLWTVSPAVSIVPSFLTLRPFRPAYVLKSSSLHLPYPILYLLCERGSAAVRVS